jgi:hypothetical protein
MRDLGEILSAMVAQKDRVADRRELLLDMSDLIVKSVSQAFACKADEVAILLLTADARHLRFIAPRKFSELGTIPVSKRESFFESVKLRDKPAPIQKMVTVPLLVRQQPVGVVQISRKGNSPAEAGPDFTAQDQKRAQEIFSVIAPLLAEARPADF